MSPPLPSSTHRENFLQFCSSPTKPGFVHLPLLIAPRPGGLLELLGFPLPFGGLFDGLFGGLFDGLFGGLVGGLVGELFDGLFGF